MKLFGRGNHTDTTEVVDELDAAVDDAGFDDTGAALDDDSSEDGLSAPQGGRSLPRAGNKKALILLFVLLLVGGGFAGMMMMGGGDNAPAVPPSAPIAIDRVQAGLPADPNAPAPMPGEMPGAVPGAPTDMAGMPPMPAPMADANTPAPIDPATGMPMPAPAPMDPTAPVDPLAAIPPAGAAPIDPATGMPMAAAPADPNAPVDPLAAIPSAGVDPNAPVVAAAPGEAAPPADPQSPVVQAPMPATDGMDDEAQADNMQETPSMPGAAPDMPAPVATAATPANDPLAPVAPETTPAETTAVAAPAAVAPAPTNTGATQGNTAVTTPSVSAAEQAMVDNADMVASNTQTPQGYTPEQISQLWATLPVEEAMVRPLPKQYLTVKKEKAAESIDSRLSTARRALNDGRTAAALQFFNDLRKDYPSDTRVLMGRAVTLQRLGQNQEALEGYEDVLVNDPKNLDALTNMLGLIKQQNPQLALEKLQDLRNLYPYNADITTQLAVAYGQVGNLSEALRYITLAEALKPDSSYVLYNKAVLYDRLGRTAEAADMYRMLIRSAADGSLDQNLPIESLKKRLSVMQ